MNVPRPPGSSVYSQKTPLVGSTNISSGYLNKMKNTFTGYYDSIIKTSSEGDDNTSSYVFLIILTCIVIIIGFVFYRDYSYTRSYVGELTDTQYIKSGGDICLPYLRCMREEGNIWFNRKDDYELCKKCNRNGKCPDYETKRCKVGGPSCAEENCETMKPSGKPCSGFLQKAAPHCEIGNVYSVRNSQKLTDSFIDFIPFNLGSFVPQNPFMLLQSYIFRN